MIRSLLALLTAAALAGSALAARSDWFEGDTWRLRLLLVEKPDGALSGGVELELDPGWHTYWRAPGDVGVAPRFDFSGSQNVKSVEVLYPAPERLLDESGLSLVYHDHIAFPVEVVALDPAKPVTLRLDAFMGVCRDVCIPASAEASVTLSPGEAPDPLARVAIERYRPLVPGARQPGAFDIESVRREDGALVIDVRAPKTSSIDLFAAGPEDWYLGQPELVSRNGPLARFRLKLDGMPTGASLEGATFRFVALSGGRAIEEVRVLGPETVGQALDR